MGLESRALYARWRTRQDDLHSKEYENDQDEQADQRSIEERRYLRLESRLSHRSTQGVLEFSTTSTYRTQCSYKHRA